MLSAHPRFGPLRLRTAAPAWLALILLLALAAPLAADPWYEHYERAESALAAGEWALAIEELQAALERRGDSGRRVRTYGMRVVDYFPYFKLGVAYHQLGRHQAALEAFATEERLGAIAEAQDARDELDRYRGLAMAARDRLAENEAEEDEQRLAAALAEARDLAAERRWDDAMAALAPALALDPDEPTANALMADYRARAVAAEAAQRRTREVGRAMDEGRRLLAQDRATEAAALLRQQLDPALSAAERRGLEALLTEAQNAISAATATAAREQTLASALGAAQQAWRQGDGAAALEQLEAVFALEPDNASGTSLRREILASRQASDEADRIAETLAEAQRLFEQGEWERSLAAANRVLALDPGRREALQTVQRAYSAISRRLLAAAGGENLPPAIRFVDRREAHGEETIEVTSAGRLELNGVVIDRTPVELRLVSGDAPAEPLAASAVPVGDLFITEFRAPAELRRGRNRFRLEAEDPEGLISSSEYTVLYRPPWFRSPLPLAGLAFIPLGLAFALRWRRQRRRKQRLQRRFNPYIAGGPVFDEKLFFGREGLIRRVLETLHNNSLMLHGERRIGKTSLLHQIRRRLETLDDPDYTFLPVAIDLQGIPEERFFALLADHIHDALPAQLQDPERLPALGRAEGYDHHHLVRELHGWIRALRATTPKHFKLVLLIDEVDELNHYDPRVNQRLRSLFMKRFSEHLVAVVAGVRIRKEWEKEGSPWYNFFEEIAVESIPPEAARRLVEDPIRGTFEVEAGVAERIVAASGGKPYLIQRRCLALVSRLHEAGRRTLTIADCEAYEAELAGGSGPAGIGDAGEEVAAEPGTARAAP